MTVDMKTLVKCQVKLAHLVVIDPAFLPVFERIEREIEALQNMQDGVARAQAIVDQYKIEKQRRKGAKAS